ncbi:hypothetical protein L6164_006400 [Bauhinia variegata]|uniref:Uncharacterized protein n=1 Tax=Bauhinia variegata TaxID=167791 RepID=A0ACB9PVR9_BAUVA|nr:hypothetical protein L6164_006400 [Bauhinia variegata]
MMYTPPSSPIFLAGRIDMGKCLSTGLAQSHFCTLQMSTHVMAKSWGKPTFSPRNLKWVAYCTRQLGMEQRLKMKAGLDFIFSHSVLPASRTIMALWRTRLLTPEQKAQIAED